MEFKGIKSAEQYSKGAGTMQSYSDFLNGYNQALKDSKAPEMLEMLRKLYANDLLKDNQNEVLELLKQATEL